jgi:hypothetical protein
MVSKYSRGSNQFQKKNKNQWKKYLSVYLLIVVLACTVGAFKPTPKQAEAQIISPLANNSIVAPASASAQTLTPTPTVTANGAVGKDTRVKKTQDFLVSKDSPLAPYAQYIVDESDKYDLSYTLIVSISGKESSFGIHNAGSFNAWGVRASKGFRNFSSWKDGIEFEANLLSNYYRENMNTAIQKKYCPDVECSSSWVTDVTSFQEDINK